MNGNLDRFMVTGKDIDDIPVKGFLVAYNNTWIVVEPDCLYKDTGHHIVNIDDVEPVINPATVEHISQPPDILGGITQYVCPHCETMRVSRSRYCRDCGQRISE